MWLTADSPGLKVLTDYLHKPRVTKTLRLLNHGQHTGMIESLHNLIISYAPKRLDFDPAAYQSRVRLAIIDHNENVGRPPITGELMSNNIEQGIVEYITRLVSV
jgi:hypothetical protein